MTLIELLIYCAILSMILVGSVFSAYSILFSEQRAQVIISSLQRQL